MKKFYSFSIYLIMVAVSSLAIISCQKEDEAIADSSHKEKNMEWRTNSNALVYPPNAHPAGRSYDEWAQAFWEHVYSLDCGSIFNTFQFNLDANVPTLSGSLVSGTHSITIDKNMTFFLPLVAIVYDYPCPDPEFEPAPGQTIEELLQEGAASVIDMVEDLEVTLDGDLIENINNYRLSTDLFYFTGNPDLVNCYDTCITGQPQAGVTDGYFLMFKKLPLGNHIITMHGEIPAYGMEWDITLNITVD